MSKTVAELFPDLKASAGSAGVCSSEELMERMNRVGPALLNRIEAAGSLSVWCIPICGGCFSLPSDLDVPLQAWFNGEALGFRSEFWLGRLAGSISYDLSQEIPWKEMVPDGRRAYTQVLQFSTTVNDVFELVSRSQADAGKVVEVRYLDTAGRETIYLATLNGDHLPSAPSQTGVGQVTRISKPRMAGGTELWLKNLRNGNRILLSVYSREDERPSYRLYHVTGHSRGSLVVKGKKKWVNLREESDIVFFGDVAAWSIALNAEAALANRNQAAYVELMNLAVRELDIELTSLRGGATAEVVDHIGPWSAHNRHPLRRRYA